MSDVAPEDVAPPRLSDTEIDQLLEKRLIAKLGTTDPDGRIHLVPMWFRRDGGHILIPTSRFTHKIRNLRRRPQAAVMIDRSRAGLDVRGVLIRGSVEIVQGDEAKELNRSIHLRYVSPEGLAREKVAAYLSSDDVTLRISMDEIISWNVAGSLAGRQLASTGEVLPLDL